MVIEIEDNIFLNQLYKGLKKQPNQGVFVTNLFLACGSNHFSKISKTSGTSSTETQRSLLKRGKHLTQEMKASFPTEIDISSAAEFLSREIDVNKLSDLFLSFGLPVTIEKEPKLIAKALIIQFEQFIRNSDFEVDNIILSEYQELLLNVSVGTTHNKKPYYPGDKIFLKNLADKSQTLNCYQNSLHTWELSNAGTQDWIGRKLVLINQGEIGPRFETDTIAIPTTTAGKDVTISVDFNSRGNEKSFNCHWEMWDSSNNNCFPNDIHLLDIRVCVEFYY
ncbi:hypothetical protein ACI1TB_05750 [Lactococcus petauri]|uniref:hypothetical protein n=1 Tax=Lactococcus petauri TaxID=1940789 RepID=UPI0038548CE0